ncbi:MAG: tetratricopeptide repeat protein [Spirochaetales bacterium]
MKRFGVIVMLAIGVFFMGARAQAQSVADQLPAYIVLSFARKPYDPLPVLRNIATLESGMLDYEDSAEILSFAIESWEGGDWQAARNRLLDHAQTIGEKDRCSSMDGLILCALYYSFMDLQGKMGGAPLESPRDQALAYLAIGQANYYITFLQVAKSGSEDTRRALGYAIAALDGGKKLFKSPAFDYYSALANYGSAETYPKTHASYYPYFYQASWDIDAAARAMPDNPETRYLEAQIRQQVEPRQALKAIEIYMALRHDDPSAYCLRGMANYYAKNYEKCIADLRIFIERDPGNAWRPAAEAALKSAEEMLKPMR